MNWKGIQKRMERLSARLQKKSQERLTIMVIPHSQERIFSLHLNWLMILFLTGTLSLAVVLTFYVYYQRKNKEMEVARLKRLYGVNYQYAFRFQTESRKMKDLGEDLMDRLTEISDVMGIPEDEMNTIPSPRESVRRADRILHAEVISRIDLAPGSDYLPSVYNTKANAFILQDHLPELETEGEYFRDGFGAYYDMPLGRPFRSFANLRDTSGFGVRIDPITKVRLEFHTGMDTSGAIGTPIYATAPGTVVRLTFMDPGYGNSILIKHKDNFYSLYAHLSKFGVTAGMRVEKGQFIGNMGRTGRVTGPHLHYEVWIGNNNRIDPLAYECATDFNTATCLRYNRKQDN